MSIKTQNKFHSILIFLFFSFYFEGCIEPPDNFTAPSYDIQINFPIGDSTYTLDELIADDSTIVASDDPESLGLLYFIDNQPISTFYVNDNLTVSGFSGSASQSIGSIKINEVPPISTKINIGDWTSYSGGVTIIFPDTSSDVTSDFTVIEQFESAVLDEGQLDVTIINSLPVQTELRNFTILNSSDNSIIAERQSPIINQPNASSNVSFDLSGKVVTNNLIFEVIIYKPGSSGELVIIPQNAGTEIIAQLTNFSIASIKAELPVQENFKIDNSFVINDSTFIERAVFSEGSFDITFNNYIDIDIQIDFELKNIFPPNGSHYRNTVFLNRNEQNKIIRIPSLEDWQIQSLIPGNLINKIDYSVTISTFESNEVSIISKYDSVSAKIEFGDIIFESVKGKIKPTNFKITESNFSFDLGDLSDKFTFDSINIKDPGFIIYLNSSIGFDLNIDGLIEGTNSIQTNSLNINLDLNPGDQQYFDLREQGVGDFINSFTGRLPDQFNISGDVTLNPTYQLGEVSRSDSVSGSIVIEIPMDIGISGGVFVDTFKVESIDISDEDIASINFVNITIETENNIPIDLSLNGFILDDFGNELLPIPPSYNVSDQIVLEAPDVDENGYAIIPSITRQEIELRNEDAQIFLENLNIALQIKILTPPLSNNSPVKFRNTDSVILKLYGSVNYRINND